MIVVTGSTGRVGRLVAQRLEGAGKPMRLLVRDATRAPHIKDAEIVVGDYGRPATLARSLEAGDEVFMVSLWIGGDVRLELHQSFVDTAAKARVGHVVYLSFVNAGPNAIFSHAREHGATEEMLRRSGVQWTSIRNGMYADDIPGWFDADGVAREPGEEARMSFSYRPALADVIATCLTQPGHEGKTYDITTPDSLSLRELAATATEVTGDSYSYGPISDEEWIERWKAQGRPEWAVESGLSSYAALLAGEFDVVSGDYEKVTGRKAASIAEIIHNVRSEMPLTTRKAVPEYKVWTE